MNIVEITTLITALVALGGVLYQFYRSRSIERPTSEATAAESMSRAMKNITETQDKEIADLKSEIAELRERIKRAEDLAQSQEGEIERLRQVIRVLANQLQEAGIPPKTGIPPF